jgi:hypothetical protein
MLSFNSAFHEMNVGLVIRDLWLEVEWFSCIVMKPWVVLYYPSIKAWNHFLMSWNVLFVWA